MAKNGWELSKVAIIGSTRSILGKNGRKWKLANHIWPTTLSASIVFRNIRFWPKNNRKIPFLITALDISALQMHTDSSTRLIETRKKTFPPQ